MKKYSLPFTKGVAKVPVIMQMEALECGAASLAMILAYYGKWVPLEQVRKDCGVSRDGSNAKNVLRAARSYGLEATGYRFEPQSLKKSNLFPCICHWEFNHFIVVCGMKGDKVYINDPGRGSYALSMEEFDRGFTGITLAFRPAESFVPSGKKKSILRYVGKKLSATKSAILLMAVTTFFCSLMEVLTPGFSRIFIDQLLSGKNPEWLLPFTIALLILGTAHVIALWIRCIYSNRLNAKFACVGASSFFWKVLHLPMDFFSQRMAGDIQMRQKACSQEANILMQTMTPLLMNTVFLILYLVVMIRTSLVLTCIGVSSVLINILLCGFISKKRVNITRLMMKSEANLASAEVAGIKMIESIKASGAEDGYFAKWAGYQATSNTGDIRYLKLNQYLGAVPGFISSLSGALILLLGVLMTIQGKFTSGMILAFQGYLQSFQGPADQLLSAGQQIQEFQTQMERTQDVMEYPSDVQHDAPMAEDREYGKLSGEVELKNVTFGYSRLAAPIVTDISLSVKPGQSIALVGFSGCGKSTISKLISGLYSPWSGEILFDGVPLDKIDRNVFTGSLAVVDQEISLFEDSLSNNIRMWDNTIQDFEVILAARDAQIYSSIVQREGGFDYRIAEGGKDLSGGERQRLEIARVLAMDPTIIILDEATSALDAQTEYQVVKAIRDRGITTIVIAHRLSTIRDCDQILVLDKGVVVEKGTHDELMAKGGLYTELVTSD